MSLKEKQDKLLINIRDTIQDFLNDIDDNDIDDLSKEIINLIAGYGLFEKHKQNAIKKTYKRVKEIEYKEINRIQKLWR